MTVRLVSNEKIAETSSKGNQEKWLDNGKWRFDGFPVRAAALRHIVFQTLRLPVFVPQAFYFSSSLQADHARSSRTWVCQTPA